MSELHLWLGLEKITVQYQFSDFCKEVIKLCCVNKSVFLLTKDNSIFCGSLEQQQEKSPILELSKTSINAIDITTNGSYLYFVNEEGQVFKANPTNLDILEKIILKEDSKCCVHGYKTEAHTVRVKKIAATDTGVLYVAENDQLWASGEHTQLNIQGDEPRPVHFFENRLVREVSCGLDFSLLLVQKPGLNANEKDDTDNEDENGDVFVSTCPTCVNEYVSSPISQPSNSETCPLGLPITPSNTHNSSTSTASKDNTAEGRKSSDESSSISATDELLTKEQMSSIANAEQIKSGQNEEESQQTDSKGNKAEDTETSVSKTVNNESETSQDSPKADKKNEFFINTDAARQFLTRQLSWVSSYGGAGEELLVECAEASLVRPSRIIKQNVSNMASLVYEGVKTVGDRVVTLSRHMSGGSETSESVPGLTDYESFEDLCCEDFKSFDFNIPSNVKYEDAASGVGGSSLAASSERLTDSSDGVVGVGAALAGGRGAGEAAAAAAAAAAAIDARARVLARAGNALLAVELWAWGGAASGQLGTGDGVRRARPSVVARLAGTGVRRLATGAAHAAAITLDGRAFAWGRNACRQVSVEAATDQSSPQQVVGLPGAARARDIGAGGSHTLVQSSEGALLYMGKENSGVPMGVFTPLDIPVLEGEKMPQYQIFASKDVSGIALKKKPISPVVQDLSTEQSFLEEALFVQSALIKPVQKKGGVAQENTVYESLCTCYNELLGITASNVMSLWECVEHESEASNVTMVLHVDEHVKVYRNYLNVLCDVISISGFMHIAKLVDVPPKLVNLFSERCHVKKNRRSHEVIVSLALSSPLTRLSVYKFMIQSLLRSNANSDRSQSSRQLVEKKLHDALAKWEQVYDEQEKRKREAEATRQFWESSGRLMELLRSPNRRLVRDSRTHPISVCNSGRFSSHWLVLLSDVLVHAIGNACTTHPLSTVWVEPLQDTDTLQNALTLNMPEETLTLYTPTANDKKEWIQCLQMYIKKSLQKSFGHQPPAMRTASYTFTKHPLYREAKYIGRWCNGKIQGAGKMTWPDGRVYIGQFQNNMMHGYGCLETPGISTYEGQWKEGQQNGIGIIKFAGGDVHEGHFKDGLAHGHGVRKQGHFMASVASVYIGEWVAGMKQGYGVMDDIGTGEKYLGFWSNNMKQGCGLIVTLDGIYYEGCFVQDVLTGHGVMVFEDGTHYEGEFRSAGVFNGKGTLTFNSGDRLEGTLHGVWNEGVKVTGTLHKSTQLQRMPQSFGKLCVAANQKWKAIFRHCYQQLGVVGVGEVLGGKPSSGSPRPSVDLQKVWENVAVLINSSRQEALRRSRTGLSNDDLASDSLDTIPQFASEKLTKDTFRDLRKYLSKAFESVHHPLGMLLAEVSTAYTATYGGVRVHPLLLSHAVEELHSITARMYEVVRLLFPSLPLLGQELLLQDEEQDDDKCSLLSDSEVVSAAALLHPVLLPRVHSALFVLYALHNKQEDDNYWKRLLKWNKQPDTTLMAFLGIDQKFWFKYSSPKSIPHPDKLYTVSPYQEHMFHDAVETLQQLKTTFSPMEKLHVIRNTFQQMTRAVQQVLGTDYLWNMDDLFPVFHFVVVRSQILQLGSEIHFIEDFIEPYLQNGELGIMFTTLKACYYQILQEKVSMSS